MYKEVIIFIIGCIVLVKSAEYAIKSVSHLARWLRLTEFTTSFLVVAVVSSLPEIIISVISALKGNPSIGIGTLLGGNIADLTLILGLVTLAAHPVRVHSRIIKKDLYLGALCMLPIILGLNGILSRLDGIILIAAGIIFMLILLKEREYFHKPFQDKDHYLKNGLVFLVSIAVMIVSAHFIVSSSETLAIGIGVPAILIGLVLVALGTTLPEFTFSLQSVRNGHSEMAIGDLWGTVIVDACLGVGLTALIAPIAINLYILSIIGIFTLFAVVFSLIFMRTDGILTKNEALTLIFFYLAFVVAQILLR
jgi:cation:H+ antiporter